MLGKVHKGHDVAALVKAAVLVGHPHLDAGDVDAGGDDGEALAEVVVVVVEVLGQEEVAVLVVLVGVDLELGGLGAAAGVDGLALGVLLRNQRRGGEFAELELALDAEQGRRAAYQRRPGGHRHVAGLDVLDDVVLFAFVAEFEVLGVEVEGGVGVVGHVELEPVAHAGADGGLDFLVEVEVGLALRLQRQAGVLGLVALDAHCQLHRALGAQLHAAGTEDFLQGAEGEVHVEDVEGLLFLLVLKGLHVALLVVLLHRAAQLPVVVLGLAEHEGG